MVVVGGFFQPLAGLAVPVLVIVAAVGSLLRKRWFCSTVCPRAAILGGFGRRVSLYRNLPAFLRTDRVRTALCGFLLVCSVGQTARNWDALGNLGRFFWLVCALSLAVALAMAYFYSPRSWCAICPVGALQDNVARHNGRKSELAEEP
ncbi:MAG TPA: 4Fe-4S binding protein [Rectinemataceae bacterium]|nr:4Fe-4S binding protein [Rectinemataceae bacterium]